MNIINNVMQFCFESVPEDPFWNTGDNKELKMHRIHAYPAKFPAFITSKALDYAKENNINTDQIADVFCGCGTVAFEAKRNNINFWGCDINPVATLIAKVKSNTYQKLRLTEYFDAIVNNFNQSQDEVFNYDGANERLKYWYSEKQYNDLARLKGAIEASVPYVSKYKQFFLCAFSNILKPTSYWLTKSIKPQYDPDKIPANVIDAFTTQCHFMITANDERDAKESGKTKVVTGNVLNKRLTKPIVDIIVTSPPYVTSYEYADLHQLSSLWLGYVDDYRELREGSIGSLHHVYNFDRELKKLNNTGKKTVQELLIHDRSKARSVAKYFLDMQNVSKTCYEMLNRNGMALFVIGNTEYKGVHIENVRHLAESLYESGFNSVYVTKRRITGKILTPYRDELGRFTSDEDSRKVYSEEYILVGRK